GSGGRPCRGALSSGAFYQYLRGPAAVATAGEEVAAVHANGRPHRDYMGFDQIAQIRKISICDPQKKLVSENGP
ncbi:MAG TPA: hypothetical protein VFX82_11925, partial [Desulfobacterales bacterium]|nr:hypothetical protein [Desulfobacterales bacterium]